MREFLSKLQRYKALNQTCLRTVKEKARAPVKKVQWTVEMKDEVDKFFGVISRKVALLNLLLNVNLL